MLTGAPTATGIPTSVNNRTWPPKDLPNSQGSRQKKKEEEEEEGKEKGEEEDDDDSYIPTSYPSVDSSTPSIPDKFLSAKESVRTGGCLGIASCNEFKPRFFNDDRQSMAIQGVQVPSNDNHAHAPTQEATPGFQPPALQPHALQPPAFHPPALHPSALQPPASAPQLPTSAPAGHSTGYNENAFNQPGPYANPSNNFVAAPNFQASPQAMVNEDILE